MGMDWRFKTGLLAAAASLLLSACASMPKPPSRQPATSPPNQAGAPTPSSKAGQGKSASKGARTGANKNGGQGRKQPQSSSQSSQAQAESENQAPRSGHSKQPGAGDVEGAQAGPNGHTGTGKGKTGAQARQTNAGERTGHGHKAVAGPPPGASSTGGERQQALERRFDRSLGQFDQRLSRENKRLQSQEDQTKKAPASESTGSGGRAVNNNKSKRVARGDNGGDQADIPHPPPKDIPSGADDDVVAKQLRQAAEHEDNPKLRAKLWDEYRQYKKNQ